MVAIATPFGGSRYASLLLGRTLRAFRPNDATLLQLAAARDPNARIVSVYPAFDPHIPGGSELDGAVTILPNPNDGQFVFSFLVASPADIQVEVVNTLGQSVFTELLRGFEGTYRKEMDLRTSSNGIYYLKITRNGTTDVHKIVYR